MNNPLETFESIRDFYYSYLETAFRIGHQTYRLNGERYWNSKGHYAPIYFLSRCPDIRTMA